MKSTSILLFAACCFVALNINVAQETETTLVTTANPKGGKAAGDDKISSSKNDSKNVGSEGIGNIAPDGNNEELVENMSAIKGKIADIKETIGAIKEKIGDKMAGWKENMGGKDKKPKDKETGDEHLKSDGNNEEVMEQMTVIKGQLGDIKEKIGAIKEKLGDKMASWKEKIAENIGLKDNTPKDKKTAKEHIKST